VGTSHGGFFKWRRPLSRLAVDIATHALASYALARGFFPGRRWPVAVAMIFAGTVADLDRLCVFFGPAAYFDGRRTYTHSILGTLFVVVLAAFLARWARRSKVPPFSALILPVALAAVLHLIMDTCQSEGVALLTPFQTKRFALDWLPTIDPWILALLLAGILIPELFRLISSEIGAKNRAPRGRNGALIALGLLLPYCGVRAMLHASSVALIETRSYHSESARHVGAYPDSLSLLTWHGVAETESQLCLVDVPRAPGRTFDADRATCFHKPEPSQTLEAAVQTRLAKRYIGAVPFPRATVAKAEQGYEVVIRSTRDLAENEIRHRVAAQIFLDDSNAVVQQSLVWASDIRVR